MNIELPEGYISVETEIPTVNKRVTCFMSNGTETVGYYYDNYYRSGWMTNCDGIMCNQIWGGVKVLGWKE